MTASVRTIPFVKASACGNDFLLIDARTRSRGHRRLYPPHLRPPQGRRRRRRRVDAAAFFRGRGNPTDQCRRFSTRKFPATVPAVSPRTSAPSTAKRSISILTGAGLKICTLIARRDSEYEFEIEMGHATVGTGTCAEHWRAWKCAEFRCRWGILTTSYSCPNFRSDWQVQRRRRSSAAQHFQQGVNVEFVVVDGRHDVERAFSSAESEKRNLPAQVLAPRPWPPWQRAVPTRP